ncbi:MAG: potassium transporter KefA [Bacteroidetes bacterium 41-46]|nr:MAG: potassium transporter KefA [Bacteroidetes bacterium 41-46]
MNEQLSVWLDNLLPWLLTHGINILIVISGTFILNKVFKRIIRRSVRIAVTSNSQVSQDAEKKREETLMRIFNGIVKILLITIATLMILSEIGIKITPILAGAGIAGIAVGFGGQYLIRDIITGLFIIIENQFRVGDVVSIKGVGGTVEDITLRMTTLRDLDGTVHHIPNGEITVVSNMSKYFSRVNLNIGVAYNTRLDHAIEVVNRVGKDLAEDPAWKEHIISAPQFLRVDSLSDSSVDLKILGDTKPIMQWAVMGELRKRIKEAFDKEGIEIPFPQLTVHKN